MESREVINTILHVKSWKSGGVRAPHKPLLLLYALARFSEGQKLISFADIEQPIKKLLADFGPHRSSYRAEYPFWRLRNDEIWEVALGAPIKESGAGDVSSRALIEAGACGSFTKDIATVLETRPDIVKELICALLDYNFPETIHEDILQAIGGDSQEFEVGSLRRKRNPKFRETVLRAYEYRCAICGFDVRMDNSPIALDAAHIKWHQANGAETENNGLALCALHHKLFDRGAFTLSGEFEILVSDRAHGTKGFSEWLMNYHGKKVLPPQDKNLYPHNENILWHTKEVFQGYARGFSN